MERSDESAERIEPEWRGRTFDRQDRLALLAYRRFHEAHGSIADEFNPLIRDEPV